MGHQVKWAGGAPKQCDACEAVIVDEFYDAKMPSGPWGCVCSQCFKDYGCSLGTGRGQHFKRQGSDFVKVAG